MMAKYLDVNLLRRDELPAALPEQPERLAELPQVRAAFETIYRRELSEDEQRRVRLSGDREWLVVGMPEVEKQVLTTGEVATRLGYSELQIRRMCEDGRFDGDIGRSIQGAYRACVGAHWRIPRLAVDLFLEKSRPKVLRRPRG